MTGNPVHDLLDSVSSGSPGSHGIDVDDLVRAGRRRRARTEGAAWVVAVGCVAVVIVAAIVLSPGDSRPASSRPTTDGATVPATTAQPDSRRTTGGPTTAVVTVTSLQLVDGNLLVAFASVRPGCSRPATLRAVEHPTEVRVFLTVPISRRALGGECSAAASPSTAVSTTLKAPLGTRGVVDVSTGRYVPVTRDTDQLVSTEIAGGFKSAGPVHPVTAQSWQQSFIPLAAASTSQADEVIVLTQRWAEGTGIGTANDLVGGDPARVRTTPTSISVTWRFEGSLLTLTYRAVSGCDFAEKDGHPAPPGWPCKPVAAPTLMPQWELLRMAVLVNYPKR